MLIGVVDGPIVAGVLLAGVIGLGLIFAVVFVITKAVKAGLR